MAWFLNCAEGAAWLLTVAVLLKFTGYRVPFAHHLDRALEPADTQIEQPQPENKPAPADPFDEGTVASFEEYWESLQ
jgi:hypothetical protein